MPQPIRVLIVDDSALMRQMLTDFLSREPDIEVVAAARDPFEARDLIKARNPDVLTLDVEMPRMDGISFLEKIMTLRPMPVIMVSSLTREGADATVRALEIGAVDCVAKPSGGAKNGMVEMATELAVKIRMAAGARMPTRRSSGTPKTLSRTRQSEGQARDSGRFIAIGASTGGVERIRDLLVAMPADCPPIIITQHMGANYVASFAARLDSLAAPNVRVASEGGGLEPGTVLIAPGDRHLMLRRDGRGLRCHLDDGPLVSGHRPSVDVMFESVAESAGALAVGVILSGMGKDGATGMAAMRAKGSHTIGEQESSCVVYGMPRAAKEAGAVVVELPLAQIAAEMLKAADGLVGQSASR